MRFVTNSEMTTFKDCRRKWYFSYMLRLRPKRKTTSGPMPLGTRVHVAMEALIMGKDPVAAYLSQAATDRGIWLEQHGLLGITPAEADIKAFESEVELGRIMVEGYVEWIAETGADADLEVISVEEPFVDGVSLMGKLDVRVRRLRDGARLFIDHKTCQSIDAWLQTAQLNEQFLHYQLLERLKGVETGETANTQGSMVNLLRKVKRTATAKPPFYHREEIHHSDVELRSYHARLQHQVADMLATETQVSLGNKFAAYPRPSRDCSWKCEFKHACPMLDDGSDVDRFLEEHFESYDPLSHYDDKETEA
jgi:RecB family exonuclease